MKSCLYCAQTETRKDIYGYCKKHNCFFLSGMKDKFDALMKRAKDILFSPDITIDIAGPVTNYYRKRTRDANDIMWDAQKTFGFLPLEIYEAIPTKNRGKWDKNIRW